MSRHVFFSPHSDDAVWSSGGLIARLCRAGETVVIATVFEGVSDGPERRREDCAAAQYLNVELQWANLPEAAARYPPGRRSVASTPSADEWDAPLIGRIRDFAARVIKPGDLLYLPRAYLSHIDHVIVCKALRNASELYAFYDEFPYRRAPETPGTRLDRIEVPFAPWLEAAKLYSSQVSTLFSTDAVFEDRLRAFARRGAPTHADYGVTIWRPILQR